RIYRVRAGDTLSTIAARHGTSTAVLARLNRDRIEHPSMIEPGQEILVPVPQRPKPASARRAPARSAPRRPAAARAPARTPAPPRESSRVHRVQRGETLALIARRYGTTVEILMRLNRDRIEHPSMIQVGQSIRVPAPKAAQRVSRPAAKPPATRRQGPSPPAAKEEVPKLPAPASR
ncbi:MAG: LysM peptidoglycan-binding domain-containing protein, partial [Candidatus Tectomicrobia bacterium]|nr:LysM peptidoglycan-binding domain-containing protein [Candidatus Tectomicrobia bacterium]